VVLELVTAWLTVALNVAEVPPAAMGTYVGTRIVGSTLITVAITPPAGAGCVRLMVQVVEPGAEKLAGLQESGASAAGPSSVKLAVMLFPPNVAETTTDVSTVTMLGVVKNTPLVAPAEIGTDGGTDTLELLLPMTIDKPPLGAGPVRPIEQVTWPGGVSRPGVQVRLLSVVTARIDKLVCTVVPPDAAEKVSFWLEPTTVVLTMKLLLVAPLGTVIEAGITALTVPPLRVTTVPPVRAGTESETVQTLGDPPVTVPGLQEMAEATGKAVSVNAAVPEVPFTLTVTCTVLLAKTVDAAALKLALFDPAATGTETGTVREPSSVETATVRPPRGAGAVRVTVHTADAGVVSVAGPQTRPAMFCTTVWTMLSVVTETNIPTDDPSAAAPIAWPIETCDVTAAVDPETWKVNIATTPS